MIRWSKIVLHVFINTVRNYFREKSWRLAAGVAFYTLFAITPLLLFVVAVGNLIFSSGDVQQIVLIQLQQLIGESATEAVKEMMTHFGAPMTNVSNFLAAIMALLFGATNALGHLRDSIDTIWKVDTEKVQQIGFSLKLLLYVTIITGMGLILLGSIAISLFIAFIRTLLQTDLPLVFQILQVLDRFLFLATVAFTCLIIYRFLPSFTVKWKSAIAGSVLTALFFSAGKTLFLWHLSNSNVASAFGALGSLVIFLIWIYLSIQILLLGASFTYVFDQRLRQEK